MAAPSRAWSARPRPRRRSASCRASSRRGCRRRRCRCRCTGRGVLSSSPRPRDCASRRAGSMVSTTTLRPASAARTASAADVVVLPTPPEPQQMTIWTRGRRSARRRRGRAAVGLVSVRCVAVVPVDCGRAAHRAAPERAGRAAGRRWRTARSRRCRAGSKATSASGRPKPVQPARGGALLQGPGGLDRELPARASFCRPSKPGTSSVPCRRRRSLQLGSVSGLGSTMLAITVPTAILVGLRSADRLLGLGHRHVLEQGDQVDHGGARAQHRA